MHLFSLTCEIKTIVWWREIINLEIWIIHVWFYVFVICSQNKMSSIIRISRLFSLDLQFNVTWVCGWRQFGKISKSGQRFLDSNKKSSVLSFQLGSCVNNNGSVTIILFCNLWRIWNRPRQSNIVWRNGIDAFLYCLSKSMRPGSIVGSCS